MENKATYTLHKLTTQNQNQSYILSIKTDETIFSYLIYFNQNKPIVNHSSSLDLTTNLIGVPEKSTFSLNLFSKYLR